MCLLTPHAGMSPAVSSLDPNVDADTPTLKVVKRQRTAATSARTNMLLGLLLRHRRAHIEGYMQDSDHLGSRLSGTKLLNLLANTNSAS